MSSEPSTIISATSANRLNYKHFKFSHTEEGTDFVIDMEAAMRPSLALMAKHFGELATVRGIITYKLSPFEQRAFAGAISQGIPNILRRIRAKLFIVAPPFVLGYLIYTENEKEHAKTMRKNPDDFKNDK